MILLILLKCSDLTLLYLIAFHCTLHKVVLLGRTQLRQDFEGGCMTITTALVCRNLNLLSPDEHLIDKHYAY